MITWLRDIIGAAWKQGRIADDWGKAVICPVFKNKGDRAECGNYRGISLLPHITKIYERILERRLRCLVEDRLGEWQYGFRLQTKQKHNRSHFQHEDDTRENMGV